MTEQLLKNATMSAPAAQAVATVPAPVTPPETNGPHQSIHTLWKNGITRFSLLLDPKQKKSTITPLDGVRAMACLIVVAYHINLITRDTHVWFPGQQPFLAALLLSGESGVTLFFVLSGFLLFMPYARALLLKSSWPSMKSFYLRRALRIIPAYYICLIILILLTHREYLSLDHWQQLLLFLTFFMDSSATTSQAINGPFWTLAVEWQFYLLLPLLALAIRAIAQKSPHSWRPCIVIFCLLALVGWGTYAQGESNYLLSHPLPPTVGWGFVSYAFFGQLGKFLQDFAVGMLVSLLYIYTRYGEKRVQVQQVVHKASLWLCGIGLGILSFVALWHENAAHDNGMAWLHPLKNIYSIYGETGYAFGFGLCVVAILFGPELLQRIFAWTPLRWIGNISFSTYMWHLPLLLFFMVYVATSIAQWNSWLIIGSYWLWVLLTILPLTALSFIFTERPGMRLSERLQAFQRKRATPEAAGRS